MTAQKGGCLCGAVRYEARPDNPNIYRCHCKFCQKMTGAPILVEVCFDKSQFTLISGELTTYTHISGGSGKEVYVHFCGTCGTKIYLTLERWQHTLNVFSGTFDNPNYFEETAENTQHVFLCTAHKGSIIPSGIRTFEQHNQTNEGVLLDPVIYTHPREI